MEKKKEEEGSKVIHVTLPNYILEYKLLMYGSIVPSPSIHILEQLATFLEIKVKTNTCI